MNWVIIALLFIVLVAFIIWKKREIVIGGLYIGIIVIILYALKFLLGW